MKCPGQDTRYWKEDAIFEVSCPNCGQKIEFFRDDTSRTCPSCGHKLPNPRLDFGCAAYCPYAEKCLDSLPPELRYQQSLVFKERVRNEVFKRLKHREELLNQTIKREKFAEILALEEGAELPICLIAAYLWDFTWEDSLEILKGLKLPQDLQEDIMNTLLGKRNPEAKIVQDAQVLSSKALGKGEGVLKTPTAKRLATNL